MRGRHFLKLTWSKISYFDIKSSVNIFISQLFVSLIKNNYSFFIPKKRA
jgi:hypothetical protein